MLQLLCLKDGIASHAQDAEKRQLNGSKLCSGNFNDLWGMF